MLHQGDSQRCPCTQEDVWYLVRGTILNSDLFNLEMLCQLRHWLRKLCFLFLKQKCSPVTDLETGNPIQFDKSQLILAGIMAAGKEALNKLESPFQSINQLFSINCTINSYVLYRSHNRGGLISYWSSHKFYLIPKESDILTLSLSKGTFYLVLDSKVFWVFFVFVFFNVIFTWPVSQISSW